MNEKITAVLRQVADKIDEVKNVDFKQEVEDIEYDLLGNQSYPRKSGIVDRLQDSFDELQDTIDDQEKELSELQEFARIVSKKDLDIPVLMTLFRHNKLTLENYNQNCCGRGLKQYELTQAEFNLVKKVVEKYGN